MVILCEGKVKNHQVDDSLKDKSDMIENITS